MRHLNENGVCLLTDVPTQLGQIMKVCEISNKLLLQVLMKMKLNE